VSNDGTLVYVRSRAGNFGGVPLVWVDREGRRETINAPPRVYVAATLAPDGSRAAVASGDEEFDIWTWDLERETLQRLTFDPGINTGPVWSPESRRLAFTQDVEGVLEIFWQAADGSGSPEQLTAGSPVSMQPTAFSPDGTRLLYMPNSGPRDIWMVLVEGPPTAGMPILASSADEGSASISPDGNWLAYESNESGDYEVYVRPFPELNAGRWRISTGGGRSPLWDPDGGELFYYVAGPGTQDLIMGVSVESDSSFSPGTPQALFRGNFPLVGVGDGGGRFYDSVDGQRFLMIEAGQSDAEGGSDDIVIVENWYEDLKRLVPTE